MELECKFSLEDLVFTFSMVVCVLTLPSLTLTAPLSLWWSCLWVMSCLVSWPLQLGAPPTFLAYHHSASVFKITPASSSLMLFPSSHHRVIFLLDHQPSSLLPVGPGMSSATTTRVWIPWGIFAAAALSNVIEKKLPHWVLSAKDLPQRSSVKLRFTISVVTDKLFIYWFHLTGPAVRAWDDLLLSTLLPACTPTPDTCNSYRRAKVWDECYIACNQSWINSEAGVMWVERRKFVQRSGG